MPQPDAILEALERLAAGEPREALAAAARALKEAPRDPDALYLLGAAHYRCGELGPAEARLRQAIAADGATPAFHALMGNVLQDRGDIGEAIKAYRRALRLQPALAEAHNDLGTAYFARGDSERAVECYRRAAALKPGNAVAWANLGAVYRRLGMAREARRALQKELFHRLRALLPRRKVSPAETELERGHPRLAARLAGEGAAARALLERARHRLDVPLARFERGEALLRQGRSAEAEAEVRAALAADAGYVPAWIRLCDILRARGALDEAEACAAAALERDEESAAAWHAAGMVLKEKGRTGAAIERFEKALSLEPGRVHALLQIGEILRYENRIAEAERRFREGLRLRPDDTGLAVDLAQTLSDQMRYDEAFALLDKVLARKPDSAMALATKGVLLDLTGCAAEAESLLASALAREPGNPDIGYNLAICRLRHGDFDAGWRGFELRRQKENFIGRYRKFPFAEWQGEPLEGKSILVYPEQGLGDELMYASCIGALAARARQVALECDPKLGELFTRSFPQCTVIARRRTFVNDWVNHLAPRPDFQVPIGSLPRFLPSSVSYLKADPEKVARWKSRLAALGPGKKIGLSWQGGVGHTGRMRRSLTLEQLAPVLSMGGKHFVSLQYTDVTKESEEMTRLKIHHWQEAIDDYDETAALVCALDKVLTVCTAIVHLTGSLGRPALVMVPFGSDWRYGASGERMAWYPTVRLVRQSRIGDWRGVLEEVAASL